MESKYTINIKGELIDLSSPKVMGVINVTPDSFYMKSRKGTQKCALSTAEKMLKDGADWLDVGGYSSRPGASHISIDEEVKRVIGAVAALKKEFPQSTLSVDTFRSEVAKEAVYAGADIVNDISAGHLDKDMLRAVADLHVPYIAMHMKGTPQTMKQLASYGNMLKEIVKYFSEVIKNCKELGINDLIIDPGFGFAKTSAQNFYLLNHLDHFRWLNFPVTAGFSRKSMIYQTLNTTPDEALNGTTVLNTLALFKGIHVLRVHDIKEAVEVVKLMNQLS